jgi:alkanesulfonate monooxygenase SsuD/methylene tetrahydromethanopterin reductase-like flavin-dependent oxidoreductase (luciferase family)
MTDLHVATTHWPAQKRKLGVGIMVPITESGHFGAGTPRFSDVVEICQTAADCGYDSVWFADHFSFTDEEGEVRGVWEAFTMMAAVAAVVPDVQIGSLVACTGFRNPGVIAKHADAIDEISGGRFILGLGAGWHKPEYDQFGFPFDYRVSRFEDAIRIIHPLLRQGEATHEGQFFQARGAVNEPRGPRPAGPPIMIGSSGERMLGLLAEFADGWNAGWHSSTASVQARIDKVHAACEAIDRDPATVALTIGSNIRMTPGSSTRPDPVSGGVEERAQLMRDFRDMGFVHYIAGLDLCTPETVREFAESIALLDADDA